MKYKFLTIIFGVLIAASFPFSKVQAQEVLTQKEIAGLAKPSVVKIVQKVKGEAVVPQIEIDFLNRSVKLKEGGTDRVVPVDEYFTGSGVIVDPNGYILTNSHVISYQTTKNLIVADSVYSAIFDAYSSISEEDSKRIDEELIGDEAAKFSEQIADFVLNNSKFNLEKTLVVLNPSSQKDKFNELVEDGFPASVISVNDNFYKDSQDAALIKISEKNLPALTLGDVSDISAGKKVFIYGYPSTAEFSDKDILEPTFTEGTISATKDSLKKDFKIFQTDAKISKGSSGGPLLDEQGRIIGLVTFITNDLTKQDGDSFAFAIPINVAKDIVTRLKLEKGEIPAFTVSSYEKNYRDAIEFLRNKECKKAITKFEQAQKSNQNFPVASSVDPYIKECENIISSGGSADNWFVFLVTKIRDAKYLILLILVVGALVAIGLGLAWAWLFRRIKKEEKELDNVEEYLHLNPDGTPNPGKSCLCITEETMNKVIKPLVEKGEKDEGVKSNE